MPYVSIVEDLSVEISSTDVRRKIRAGEPLDHMVPPAIRDYIARWNLYKYD